MFLLHLFNHQLHALRYIHPLNEIKSAIYHFEFTCETGSGSIGAIWEMISLLSLAITSLHRKVRQTSFSKQSHGAIRHDTDQPIHKRKHR